MAFHPLDDFAQKTIPLLAKTSDPKNDFLQGDAGEDGLVHQNGCKDIAVPREEFLQKRGATAGWGNDKDGLADRLSFEAGKENMVQGPSHGDHDPERRKENHKRGHDHPAAETERLPQIGVKEGFGS